MEGLEASEVMLGELSDYEENENFRIDSDFYKKQFILDEIMIKNLEWDCLGNLSKSIINFGAYSLCNFIEFVDNGVPYLNVVDIKDNIINWENAKRINAELSHRTLYKSLAIENQVLLTIAGTIGNASVAYKLPEGTNSNQAIANITTKEILNPFYLSTYLNSRFGRSQTQKLTISSVQPNLLLTQVKRIKVPIPSIPFQNHIEATIKKGHNKREQSQALYRQAEDLLLETIGLKGFKPSRENKSVKSFKESFLTTGRLDAEYYQPKYEEIENKIKNMSHACLSELTIFINHGKQPPYIENGTVRVFSQKWIGDKSIDYSFLEATDDPFTSAEFAAQNSKYVARKNDILYYSVGANIGYCHNYLLDEPIMPGSFITLIRANSKKIDPVYLGIVLNSLVGRLQAEKHKSATAQPYIYPKDISKFVIPLIAPKIQRRIAALITKSFTLRSESERLLDEAKETVEREIEKG
ncbi:MAG: restriction endonuclease subunit S [Helicobacteraceae bacterium]|nr:restriction endonuclease subunit S [Helicobacteraceae bacterium]